MITITKAILKPGCATSCVTCGVMLASLAWLTGGCGSSTSPAPAAPAPPAQYALTVDSTNPATGVAITATPADSNAKTGGTTSFSLSYTSGMSVTLQAPATVGTSTFAAWSGCTQSSGQTCSVSMTANVTVSANYVAGANVTVSPSPATVTIGSSLQFNAVVTGTANTAVTWSVSAPAGSTLSPGTISTAGLYQTPYPAPASVTVTATSQANSVATAQVAVTLVSPATAAGPALSVNTSAVTHAISPLIYGMNNYQLAVGLRSAVTLPVERWGGDSTTRYNYLLDVDNSAADYYFETNPNTNTAYPAVSEFNTMVQTDEQFHTATIATVPLIGFTTKRQKACGYSVAKYGVQTATDPYNPNCGNGVLLNGNNVTGNDPADTSTVIDQTFASGWVTYLVGKFGSAANGGVAFYALDNEPEYWNSVHRDVHPATMTYDEVTQKGITYAQAIKTADPTAQVTGPVISGWTNYFYSAKDLYSGWSTGPCYCYNGNPVDRQAHGNTPLLAYYLQQFSAAQTSGGTRLLDYLDLHGYYAAKNAAFATAGDTALQAARLNSTRVFWDPTYTDPAYTDPNVTTNPPAYPVQMIPFMRNLVAQNYPGTKLAITEYNWGGQESINGALAQAEILALFGREGLDLGALWGPPDPVTQLPGLIAFELFQSYDGQGSAYGDGSLAATSANQSQLAIYAAQRSKDNMLTVLVLNKSFGALTSSVTLTTSATSAQVYQYSNANLSAITKLSNATVSQNSGAASVTMTFPAQSITLLVMPR